MENNIKALIFDLGRVLIDFDHTIAAKKIYPYTTKTPQEIYELFFDSGLTGMFEEGKISPQDFFLRVKDMLGLRLDYERFVPIWNEIFSFSKKNQEVYDLAKGLKSKYKLALLSNINVLHFEYLRKNFPVFDIFDHVIASYTEGLKKPDPLIYKNTLKTLGALPHEVFYTDDRLELIQSAGVLGIRSFVFADVLQLKRDLLSNGVELN